MAKPEWGTKRMCQSCGTRFYDLRRSTPTCPKCGTVYAPRATARPRRAPAGIPEPAPVPVPVPVPVEVAAVAVADLAGDVVADDAIVDLPDDEDDEEEVEVEAVEDDDDDQALMEDASELGEDDDDVSEVMEHVDDGDLSDRG